MGAGRETEIRDLRKFRAELKAAGAAWPKELQRTHKKVAELGRKAAVAEAQSMGGVWAKAANQIKSYATANASSTSSSIGFPSGGIAGAAFWGTKRRTGWYAAGRYAESGAVQHPPWIGDSWDVAVAGQGPYAINNALARELDPIIDEYARMIDELAAAAFPDP